MGTLEDIKNDIAELKKAINTAEEQKKEKKFKLPWGTKVSKGQAKTNWVTVVKINENGNINFKKLQIEDQTVMEEGIPRLAAAGYVMFFKGNPLIILPAWSVEPFSPLEHLQKSLLNGSNTNGYKLLLAKMKMAAVSDKKPMSNALKWIIGIGLAGIIGYALISGGKS